MVIAMTENKRFNARKNTDDDFEERLKVELEDIVGIVETEPTDSVELKKEYYQGQSKDKHYTYLDYSKTKFIGSFYCNDEFGEKPLTNEEIVELLNENEQLKSNLKTLQLQDNDRKQYQRELKKENEQLKTLITMVGYTIKDNNGELSLEFKSKLR